MSDPSYAGDPVIICCSRDVKLQELTDRFYSCLPVNGCHCARQSAFSIPPSYRASPKADAVGCGH